MGISRYIYQILEAVVGSEYITDDQAIMEAYAKQPWAHGILMRRRPEVVVLPGSVEDVQTIVKLANRFKLPFIPAGGHNWEVPRCDNTIIIDMKRMNKILDIDEKNQYALIEPGVTNCQLSAETMKRGLISLSSGAGGPSSVIGNAMLLGIGGISYRLGYNRMVLGLEWVLPTGDLLYTGSAGLSGNGFFWPQGPGPDMRGLMRGFVGVSGGHGIITKMGIKLLTWPGPETFPCKGISPDYQVELPPDRFRFHLIRYPNLKSSIQGIYEIGRAEIGTMVQKLPGIMMAEASSRSSEENWERLEYYREMAANVVLVWLVGFHSPRQVTYEEKVLQQIIKETGGEDIPEEDRLYLEHKTWSADMFRWGTGARIFRTTGTVYGGMFGIDSLDHSKLIIEQSEKVVGEFFKANKFPNVGYHDWVTAYDFSWQSHSESNVRSEMTVESAKNGIELAEKSIETHLKEKLYCGLQTVDTHDLLGPHYGSYHQIMRKIKKSIDPQNVANPPNPISIEEIE